ncbi:MAG TPA: carboxypeptidase regulatory-like domain-containing protein [Anaeromyxobacter sp.]|nr:carboxypeptidase regulatory-like domain-containing protein [Anaeromyxobacter sp.]
MNLELSKRTSAILVAGVLASVGCSSSSSSKTVTGLGTLAGTVTNGSGSAIAGVQVTTDPRTTTVVTDGSGKYSLLAPAGSYSVSFTADNYAPASASASLSTDSTTTLNQTLVASPLAVTVNLPDALKGGGPAGFNTTVSGITATVTLNGSPVSADGVTWSIVEAYDRSAPPAAATPSPAAGATTSFAIPDFETVRKGANAWMSNYYGTTGTADDFEYIPVPERDQLIPFSPQQVEAMSFLVVARATNGQYASTGSAVVSPVTISGGRNYHSVGMMIVGNAPCEADSTGACTNTYNWTLQYLSPSATDMNFGAPPAGVTLQGATTKNPYFVPTVTGVYALANGSDKPLYFRVSTYHGSGTSDTAPGSDGVACAGCHGGPYSLAPIFAEWANSAHGNTNWQNPFATPMGLFQYGLDGNIGPHYSQSCIQCHTDGYTTVPSARGNKGFYDLAVDDGWTFPAKLQAGNFDALPADLKYRAGIQCEDCHGPLEPTEHGQPENDPGLFGLPLSPKDNMMGAGVCMYCHDELSHHDKGSLWSASPHAQTDLVEEATVESRGTSAAHCGRCHAGEGFVAYVDQQQAGTAGAWGLIARPPVGTPTGTGENAILALTASSLCTPAPAVPGGIDPNCICAQTGDYQAAGLPKPTSPACYHDPSYAEYLSNLGLNEATAHSQTCQACHDPHTTTLRVDGNSGVTAAGFNLQNAGSGALCVVCHNTRNGVVFSDSVIASWGAPHTPSQGDVFVGRNAYFFGKATPAGFPASTDPTYNAAILSAASDLPNESAHKILGETCAECHVKLIPADMAAQFKPANTNHTFRSDRQVCSNCHGANIGDIVAGQVDDKMTELSNALGVLFRDKINQNGLDSAKYDTLASDGSISDNQTANSVTINTGSVQKVVLSTVHGSPALILTLTDGSVVAGAVSSTSAPTFKLASKFLFGASNSLTANQQIVAKAFYNFLFIQGGGAHGFHNPSFVNGVLDTTATALQPIVTAGATGW